MPDFFDAIDLYTAPLSERGLGEACGNADPQAAGDELQKRPAAGRVEGVEPGFEQTRHLAAARPLQSVDDFGKARDMTRSTQRCGPDERHCLGEIADKIVR